MKKSEKVIYDVEIIPFMPYEIMVSGTWVEVYILSVGTRKASGKDNMYTYIQYIDIVEDQEERLFMKCSPNNECMVSSDNAKPATYDPTMTHHRLVQYYKLMGL